MPHATFRRFCFTWNNWPSDADVRLRRLAADPRVRYLIFGREVAPETGTPHLQGFVIYTGPTTFHAVKGDVDRSIHVEAARASSIVNRDYCMKDGNYEEFGDLEGSQGKRSDWDEYKQWVTDLGRLPTRREVMVQWTKLYARYPKAVMDIAAAILPHPVICSGTPRLGWQTRIEGICRGEPNPRKIHFVVDSVGNGGKTWMTRYLMSTMPDEVQVFRIGKRDDLAHSIDVSKKIFLFDVPREQMIYLQYSILESIKDQLIFSPKYDSTLKIIAHATVVIVFCNEAPDLTVLSVDRYSVITIS